MIKINDILEKVNEGLKTHYFKDIKTNLVAELVTRQDIEGNDKITPSMYIGDGQYEFLQDDTNGLNIYHRILDFSNDEDLEGGFGRNSLTTEEYKIRTIFFGERNSIEESCSDINLYLAKEFKKLIPRKVSLDDINRILVTGINYDKEIIKKEEYLSYSPESVLFTIDMEIMIKGIEDCNVLKCS